MTNPDSLSDRQWDEWDKQIIADQERLGIDEVVRRLSGRRGDDLSEAMICALETKTDARFVKT